MKHRTHSAIAAATLGVALLVSTTAWAAGVSVANASAEQLEEAKAPYLAGVEAMEAGRYAESLEQFRRSYEVVASPNSRLMLGRALVKLGRLVEAYREFEGTAEQASELASSQQKYEKTALSARHELDDLKADLAFVRVMPGAQVRIGGRLIPADSWGSPQPVTAGTVEVEITASDGRQLIKQLSLEPGLTRELTAELPLSTRGGDGGAQKDEPAEEEEVSAAPAGAGSGIPRKTVGYAVGAVGVVGAVTFIGLTIAAESKFGNLKQNCVRDGCPVEAVDNAKTKSTMLGVGYAGLGIGIVGLGVGTYLVLTDNPRSKSSTALHVGPSSVSLVRRF